MKHFTYLFLFLFVTTFFSCSNDDENPLIGIDNFITSFTLNKDGNEYKAYINENEIVVYAPLSVSLEGAKATIKISEQATIFPDPSGISDWDNERQFKVTSYGKTEKTYTYKIVHSSESTQKNIVLSTQQEIDNFKNTNIVQILGSLTIGSDAEGATAIENLDGLSNLKEVTYDINLINYTGEGLTGLKNLVIAGAINIKSAANLKTIDLPKLHKSPVKGLNVTAEKLESVNLPMLTECGNLYIRSLNIAALNFPLLETLYGDFALSANQDINDVGVNPTGTIQNVNFPALKKVEGSLYISGFAAATTIGFPLLETAKSVRLMNTKTIGTLSMPKLKATEQVYFKSLYVSKALDLTSLETINGDFTVNASGFNNCSGLSALRTVNGKLTLWSGNFKSMEGLSNLTIKKGIEVDKMAIYTILDLSNIIVPSGATITLGSNCGSIDELIFPGTVEATISLSTGFRSTFPIIKGIKSAEQIEVKLPNHYATPTIIFNDLEEVANLSVTGKFSAIKCPNMTAIGSLSITNCGSLSTLDFSKLEKITSRWSGITINKCSSLTDFTTFATLFTTYAEMESDRWEISECGYNPTFENMKAGQYTKQ